MAIKGHVDRWSDSEISGWFWDPQAPAKHIDFRLVSKGTEICRGRADMPRADLKAAGIGEGAHAFRLRTPVGFYAKEGVSFHFGDESLPCSAFTSGSSEILDEQHASSSRTSLFYFPDYSPTNYYQVGLYGEAPPSTTVQAGSLNEALEYLVAAPVGERVVFHLHWTTPILAPAMHEGDARARKDGFVAALRAFVRRGGVFYWTVHNLYPHDAKYLEVERELCRDLASIAAKILVHNKASVDLVVNAYAVDASKIHHLPHGNYEPLIEFSRRGEARERIRRQYGIGSDDFVFAFLGQIRPYKGIDDLLASFAQLRKRLPDRKVWLLIGGKPVHPVPAGKYARLARALPGVVINEVFLDGDEFNHHMFAADVAVCPYKNILTSGSILHALSAGLPVVAPDLPQIAELVVDGTNGQLFGKDVSLAEAMFRAMAAIDAGGLDAAKCMESVATFQWPGISREFFRIVEGGKPFAWVESTRHDLRLRAAEKTSDTACIVVNYEHLEDVARLVSSLRRLERAPDVIVVDSGSPGLHERAFMQLPDAVGVLRVGRNVGYAAAVNIGVDHCRSNGYEYLCVINPDMVAFPGSIEALREHVRREGDVLCSGTIYHDLGRKSVWYSGGRVQLKGMVRIGHDTDEFTGVRETEYLSGACIFGALATFDRVGEWPEDYFLYFEETDWCQRARSLGIRLQVVSDAGFAHIKRSTLGGMPKPYYLYYYVRNALVFGARHSQVPLASQLQQLHGKFIAPWIERIEKKGLAFATSARRLVARAVEDGLAGRLGQADDVAWTGLPDAERTLGHLELIRDGTARGWVAGTGDSLLRVVWNGRSKGVFVASIEGGDLPVLENGSARRFVVPLPGATGTLEVQQWPHGGTLHGGVVQVEPAQDHFRARADGVAAGRLSGWAAECCNGKSAQVEIFIDDALYGTATGTLFRKDLQREGIRDGYAGFSMLLDKDVLSRDEIKVALRRPGAATKLDERQIRIPARKTGLPEVARLGDFLRWSIRNGEPTAEMEGFYPLRDGLLADISSAVVRRAEAAPPAAKVSVVMPAYNREETIARSIGSVLAQTHGEWELLLVDDGSTDSTVAVVNGVLEALDPGVKSRISLVLLDANQGVSAARNAGLDRATGDYVAYLDSDNTWHPAYLRTMLHALETSGRRAAYCGQDIYYSDRDRELLYAVRLFPFCLSALESRNFIDLNAFMHARQGRSGGIRFNTCMRRLVDWEFIIRLTRDWPPALVPAFLSRYDFNKASNQITATVDFTSNVAGIRATVGERDGPEPDGPMLPVDVADCLVPSDTSGLMMEQFSALAADGRAHPVGPDGVGRPGVPTLVLFRASRISPGSLQRMHRLLVGMDAPVVTGRLLAEPGAAKKMGIASYAGVLECDLNLFELAGALDEASVREAGECLRARSTLGVGFALLAPGLWEQACRLAGDAGIDAREALDRITAALSDTGTPAVLFDPSVVAYDIE